MAAALFRAAAANPKLTQTITQAASKELSNPKNIELLKSASNQVREKFSSASNTVTGAASTTTSSTTYESFRTMQTGLCKVLVIIWEQLKKLFRFLFLTRSPAAYVVWLLILIAIILGVAFGIHFGRKRSTLAKNKNLSKSKSTSSALSEKPTNDGYRKKAMQQSVSGEPNKVDGYKRNLLSGGRCDGLNWIDSGKDCLKILPPPMIRWELNQDEYTDLGDIPETLLQSSEAFKDISAINIPYKFDKDRYYVDCANMTYEDDNPKTPNRPAKLFIQKNIKDNLCQFVEKSATTFNPEKRRTEFKDRYTICEK
jgi:hypothetical protein